MDDPVTHCDRCSAPALVRVAHPAVEAWLPLDFCGHHYRAARPTLDKAGWLVVHDARPRPTPVKENR